MSSHPLPVVLVAEDDPGDRALMQQAFQLSGAVVDVRFVANGEDLVNYLNRQPPWDAAPAPDLILLDLNMPRMSGRESLRLVKTHPQLKSIPVVVLTSSRADEDIADCYAHGANSYIPKPDSLGELVRTITVLCEFWFKIGVLPGTAER